MDYLISDCVIFFFFLQRAGDRIDTLDIFVKKVANTIHDMQVIYDICETGIGKYLQLSTLNYFPA